MKQTYSTPTQKTPDFIKQYPSPHLDFSRVAAKLAAVPYGSFYSNWITTLPECNLFYLIHGAKGANPLTQDERILLAEFTHLYLLDEYASNPQWHYSIYSHVLA
jgi:hypothetical protein